MELPSGERGEKVFQEAYDKSFRFWTKFGLTPAECHNYAHSSALMALSEMKVGNQTEDRLQAITAGMMPNDPRRSIAVALANNLKLTVDRCRDILGRMVTTEGRA